MTPYVIDGQTLCLPMISPLILNRFGLDDTFVEDVQSWLDQTGFGPIEIELGCYQKGNFIQSCRYISFDSSQDAMMFKLKWL